VKRRRHLKPLGADPVGDQRLFHLANELLDATLLGGSQEEVSHQVKALLSAVLHLKSSGKTVLVITHRINLISAVDRILILREGQIAAWGPRDEVLAAMKSKAPLQAPKS